MTSTHDGGETRRAADEAATRQPACRPAIAAFERAVGACCFTMLVSISGCGTVDLGDNFVPPDLVLNEDFFFCRIQPEVISANSCASGAAGESGSCHTARSALRLDAEAESDAPPRCEDDSTLDPAPESYLRNLEALRFTVQSDPLASPIYRRPLALDSHPRAIFAASDAEADLIIQWITQGAQ